MKILYLTFSEMSSILRIETNKKFNMKQIILLAIALVIFVFFGIVLLVDFTSNNIRFVTGPESSATIQPEYPFQAKLITKPDHHKQMQWKAVPLTYGWKDTILVDFDYDGGMDLINFKEGDVVNLIGIKDSKGSWFYRHDDQYWMRERHQRYLRQ